MPLIFTRWLSAAAATAAVAAALAAPAPAAAQNPQRLDFQQYSAPVPAGWQSVPPGSSFRIAQYKVPAAPGAGEGEAVVFYFGKGQGGPVAANIARWVSQFSGPEGRPVAPRTETLRVAGLPTTVVELTGSYARGIGMAQATAAKPGQTLLAAVIETPHGNLTLQLHGDQATVAQQRAGFMALVTGLALRQP